MFRIGLGIFVILHGLVHLLYMGQSSRLFELQPGMIWPDGSWIFSNLIGNRATRMLANFILVLTTVGYVLGGIGLTLKQDWWRPAFMLMAIISSLLYILCWDGSWQHLDNKGIIGIAINIAIFAIALLWKPS